MKRISPEGLDTLHSLLVSLRSIPQIVERKPGVFYCRSKAFLHFHEEKGELYADISTADGWVRYPVNNFSDITKLLTAVESQF